MDDPNGACKPSDAAEAGRNIGDGQGADRGTAVLVGSDRGVAPRSAENTELVRSDPATRRYRSRDKPKIPLTQERLKELLHYDPDTGVLTWLKDRRAGSVGQTVNRRAGDKAGCVVRQGKVSYITIRIDGVPYPAHTLGWFYQTGEWLRLIDHRDGDGLNNRFRNLRPCTRSTNAANTAPPVNNTSGVKGVSWDRYRSLWAVEIRCQNRRHRLGRFASLEEARAVYQAKAEQLFGEYARPA